MHLSIFTAINSSNEAIHFFQRCCSSSKISVSQSCSFNSRSHNLRAVSMGATKPKGSKIEDTIESNLRRVNALTDGSTCILSRSQPTSHCTLQTICIISDLSEMGFDESILRIYEYKKCFITSDLLNSYL